MRPLYSVFLLTAFLLSSCAPSPPTLLPAIPSPPTSPTLPLPPATSSPSPAHTATFQPPTPSPTPPGGLPSTSAFTLWQGTPLPLDRPLIAYEGVRAQGRSLLLADPAEKGIHEFSFPGTDLPATPFLAGLSPDARYFVYFEGGRLETLYDVEHLRLSSLSTPDLRLHILDLRSGELAFSKPLLSPSFPRDLAQIAEKIKDDWNFTFQHATFEDVIAATQELLLDNIRNVAWSPDGSLLAFAAQDPGPSSDLYLFSPESRTARGVTTDSGHVLKAVWAPDSSALIMVASLYDRMAREDTTYLLSREGALRASNTSQVWFFSGWHDSTNAFLTGGTDAGDYFELKAISAADGTISTVFDGSYDEIAFTPDLSTFVLSSNMPTAPIPGHYGLYLGKRDSSSLRTLSNNRGWGIAYWGSERFLFAASSIDEGTIGITPDGELVTMDDGYWELAASPDGRYLAGYNRFLHGNSPRLLPGLRIFDSNGQLLESNDDIAVTCVSWDAASTALAYQVESRLYLWDAASRSTSLVSDQLSEEECAFKWVRESPQLQSRPW